MNQTTNECLGKKPISSYLHWGQTNQAIIECFGKKSKSSYLWDR